MNIPKVQPKQQQQLEKEKQEAKLKQQYNGQVETVNHKQSTILTQKDNNLMQLFPKSLKPDSNNNHDVKTLNTVQGSTKTITTSHKLKKVGLSSKERIITNNDDQKEGESQQRQHHQNNRQKSNRKKSSFASKSRLAILAQIGEDWLYLALLGTIMALISFSMDSVITLLLNTRLRLFKDVSNNSPFLKYLAWCVTPIVLVTFSSGFVHLCSPTAIGSGIPEMKTILRGVILKEYLTFRTLIAKIVGLTFTLGSGLPLGKEGPFVHMASIVATLLSKLVASFQGIYENESRTSEMLSAACAVGVAATFYAPIGGVLFSIEVTTVYFAVRNYWRGFFAACCGATIWRLLGFWIKNDESITALFKTNFRTEYPFDPIELLIFSFIGATCGLAGAGYIKFHREIVKFFRSHKRLSEYFQKHRYVYPIMVTFLITTVTYPPFVGKYTASTLSTHTTIEHLFSNRTWSLGNQDLISKEILDEWTTPNTSFHLHLVLYIIMLFWTSAVASTIPIPSGLFIPVLKMGAAYGRLIGELMHSIFPDGITYGGNELLVVHSSAIVPGSYAVVGAAAFSGAVTHTISTSVILFEMTGQIVHIIPVILGVLIANAVCQSLQPSIYDSIIEMKKLPYLPPIASSNSVSHKILVKDFMNTKLAFISKEKYTYAQLKKLLILHKKINSFPLVESKDSMKLLGSIARFDLLKLLYIHLGRERRLQEVNRRNSDVQMPQQNHLILTTNNNEPSSNKTTAGETITDLSAENNQTDDDDSRKKRNEIQVAGNKNKKFEMKTLDNNNNDSDEGSIISVTNNSTEAGSSSTSSCAIASAADNDSNGKTMFNADKFNIEKSIDKNSPAASIAGDLNIGNKTRRPNVFGHRNRNIYFDERKFSSLNDEAIVEDFGSLMINEIREIEIRKQSSDYIGIAKMVNHYDKGSLTDEDQLIDSMNRSGSIEQVLEQQQPSNAQKRNLNKMKIIADNRIEEIKFSNDDSESTKAKKTIIEIRDCNLVQPSDNVQSKTTLEEANKGINDQLVDNNSSKENKNKFQSKESPCHYNFLKRLSPTSFASSNFKSRHFSRPLSPLVELKAASSFDVGGNNDKITLVHSKNDETNNKTDNRQAKAITTNNNRNHSTSTINSNISRPKSILKTSSTAENLSNIYLRNISIQSLTNNNNGGENFVDLHKQQLGSPDFNDQKTNPLLFSPFSNNNFDKVTFACQNQNENHANFTLGAGGDSSIDLESLNNSTQANVINRQRRRVRLPKLRVVDMTPEEQERWEADQLNAMIDITNCQIDEAPFQLVQQTSLYRVHSLFSMLGLNHAYVTSYGRLVGIVALKDIRYAIEEMLQE